MIRRARESILTPTPTTPTPTPPTTLTTAATVVVVVEQLDKANSLFHMALNESKRRKELLEQALLTYANILPYVNPVIGKVILGKIHAIEQWLELLICNHHNSSSAEEYKGEKEEEENVWL